MEFRFATTDARLATSFPTGMTWCIAVTGVMPLSVCMQQIIFLNLLVACARPHVKVHACWGSTKTQCLLSKSKLKSSIMLGMKVGCSHTLPAPKLASALQSLVLVLLVLLLPSNSRELDTKLLFWNALIALVVYCVMEFQNSRWKRSISIDA